MRMRRYPFAHTSESSRRGSGQTRRTTRSRPRASARVIHRIPLGVAIRNVDITDGWTRKASRWALSFSLRSSRFSSRSCAESTRSSLGRSYPAKKQRCRYIEPGKSSATHSRGRFSIWLFPDAGQRGGARALFSSSSSPRFDSRRDDRTP